MQEIFSKSKQRFQGGTSFMDQLCYLCLVFVMLSSLFIAALWALAGKGLTSWLLLVMFNSVFDTFPCGFLGQVWYLIVSIRIFAAFLTFIRTVTTVSYYKSMGALDYDGNLSFCPIF